MKTLHPAIYAGLLAKRDKPEHMKTLAEHNLPEIDLVVCNLYPFEQTVAKPGVTEAEAIENIDIGGPCMVRAAAKNFEAVAVVTDPINIRRCCRNLLKQLAVASSRESRHDLRVQAFARIAEYDHAIVRYFSKSRRTWPDLTARSSHVHVLASSARQDLRYGENPHQAAPRSTSNVQSASTPASPPPSNSTARN